MHFLAAALLSGLAALTNGALVNVADFGYNPTGIQMAISVPAKLATNPPIILALHYCGGTGQAYAQFTKYAQLSEQRGFITIFPTTTHDNHCWDVATVGKSLLHEGGGDSQGLANMVKYTISKYGADPKRVFVTGSSSGGMMTNVMAATYPELFAAGSVYSGVSAGCLAGSPGASPTTADPACANGQHIKPAEEWATQFKGMSPNHTGPYPKMQVWHGTVDNLVNDKNFGEQNKQWSGIFGIQFTRNVTNTSQSGYTEMIFGDGTKYRGFSAAGVGHTVPVHDEIGLQWFGI